MTERPIPPGIESVGQISVPVKDVDRAVAFYRDTLGLTFLFRTDHLAFFDCGGVRLMVSRPEKSEFDHPASILYYRVADIHMAFRSLRDRGVAIEGEPHLVARLPDHDLWMGFLRDSEGNVFALMSEVREGA